MEGKVIDFKKSKEKLLNKKFPNISSIAENNNGKTYYSSSKALQDFQNIFFSYSNYVVNKSSEKEIKLDEVMIYFNRYFDEIYKEFTKFDDLKVSKFKEAMDYAMLSSGKRIRPFLMLATYNFLEGKNFMLLAPFMVAMEMIHTFSLVHDDLPCMDNDELRRGKPTVWKKYGEDIAVLVGDALFMHAINILNETIYNLGFTEIGTYVITASNIITKLAGLDGMIAGQVFDVMNTGNNKLSMGDINYMYEKKTTALIVASMLVGASLSVIHSKDFPHIDELGQCLGESYQIKDDLLEIESNTETIGKSVDSDKKNGKVTFVSIAGIDEAKKRLEQLENRSYILIDKLTNQNNYREAMVYKEIFKYIYKREK